MAVIKRLTEAVVYGTWVGGQLKLDEHHSGKRDCQISVGALSGNCAPKRSTAEGSDVYWVIVWKEQNRGKKMSGVDD